MMTAGSALIDAKGLRLSYRDGGGKLIVVDRIDFSVAHREFVTILGPSGCGKTTLLKSLAGLIQIDSGQLKVGGLAPELARKRRQLGMVFQHALLLPWRTVLANVLISFEVGNGSQPPASAKRAGLQMLEKVGLLGYEDAYPSQLSGGMQSRVAIARALVYQPEILLMDEPFADVDDITRIQLNIELLRLKSSADCTVVFVTHSLQEAVFLSDRILVLGPRPSSIVKELPVTLPSRKKIVFDAEELVEYIHAVMDSPDFAEYVHILRSALGEAWWR